MDNFNALRVLEDLSETPLEDLRAHLQYVENIDVRGGGHTQQTEDSISGKSDWQVILDADSDLLGTHESFHGFFKPVSFLPDVVQH